jgi:DNA-binding NtrC family response regulator
MSWRKKTRILRTPPKNYTSQTKQCGMNDKIHNLVCDMLDNGMGLWECVIPFEKALILEALTRCRGKVETTARMLKISKYTLYPRIRQHDISIRNIKQATKKRR